jgi:glycosyltransferase involved in cell wall biosynthesis
MKILFDYQIFDEQKVGGISRYFYELYKKFNADPDIMLTLPVECSENIFLKSIENYKNLPSELINPYEKFLPKIKFRGKWKVYSLFSKNVYAVTNKERSLTTIDKNDFDVFHPSYYNPYHLEKLRKKPLVITVHDMINEIFPGFFPLDAPTSCNKRAVTKRADKIIVVSESTKRDLVYFFDIPPEKITVIYHGNSFSSNNVNRNEEIQLPDMYLLFVGNRLNYKNFYFFIEAVKELLIKTPELKIVCTWQPFSESEKLYFRLHKIENSLVHYFADDDLLAQLYSSALAFVFPSLYEGFGIPVLEAFSCGCPCLLSNTSSLPEVGGEAAIYFDPQSSESIQIAVNKILYNKELRNDLRLKGYNQLKRFSWDKTAAETKEVYKKLC